MIWICYLWHLEFAILTAILAHLGEYRCSEVTGFYFVRTLMLKYMNL